MNEKAIFALMNAANMNLRDAKKIIANLEAEGLTIYRKKIHKNPRRARAVSQIQSGGSNA